MQDIINDAWLCSRATESKPSTWNYKQNKHIKFCCVLGMLTEFSKTEQQQTKKGNKIAETTSNNTLYNSTQQQTTIATRSYRTTSWTLAVFSCAREKSKFFGIKLAVQHRWKYSWASFNAATPLRLRSLNILIQKQNNVKCKRVVDKKTQQGSNRMVN